MSQNKQILDYLNKIYFCNYKANIIYIIIKLVLNNILNFELCSKLIFC